MPKRRRCASKASPIASPIDSTALAQLETFEDVRASTDEPPFEGVRLRTQCGHSVTLSQDAARTTCGFVRGALEEGSDGSASSWAVELPPWFTRAALDVVSAHLRAPPDDSGAAEALRRLPLEALLDVMRGASFIEADVLVELAAQAVTTHLAHCSTEILLRLLPGLRDAIIAASHAPPAPAASGLWVTSCHGTSPERLSRHECATVGLKPAKSGRFSRRLALACAEECEPPTVFPRGIDLPDMLGSEGRA